MLSPRTDAKLAKGLRLLAEDQRAGHAPPAGEVGRSDIARRAGVSEGTILNIERMFKARLASSILRDPHAPHHLARIARDFLTHL